jgi:hypothetical protein
MEVKNYAPLFKAILFIDCTQEHGVFAPTFIYSSHWSLRIQNSKRKEKKKERKKRKKSIPHNMPWRPIEL